MLADDCLVSDSSVAETARVTGFAPFLEHPDEIVQGYSPSVLSNAAGEILKFFGLGASDSDGESSPNCFLPVASRLGAMQRALLRALVNPELLDAMRDAAAPGKAGMALRRRRALQVVMEVWHMASIRYGHDAALLVKASLRPPLQGKNAPQELTDNHRKMGRKLNGLVNQLVEQACSMPPRLKCGQRKAAHLLPQAKKKAITDDTQPSALQELPGSIDTLWCVVGGERSGGIVVRAAADLRSAMRADRLATGAVVAEIEWDGQRLHYRKVGGAGPPTGWVSAWFGHSKLLEPCS